MVLEVEVWYWRLRCGIGRLRLVLEVEVWYWEVEVWYWGLSVVLGG